MSDERQPIEILLEDMRRRLAGGGLTYSEAVMLDDIIKTIADSIREAADDGGRDADPRRDGGRAR